MKLELRPIEEILKNDSVLERLSNLESVFDLWAFDLDIEKEFNLDRNQGEFLSSIIRGMNYEVLVEYRGEELEIVYPSKEDRKEDGSFYGNPKMFFDIEGSGNVEQYEEPDSLVRTLPKQCLTFKIGLENWRKDVLNEEPEIKNCNELSYFNLDVLPIEWQKLLTVTKNVMNKCMDKMGSYN